MKLKLLTLSIICAISTGAWASKLFIPMDATGQTNHLKAYGISYAAMLQGIKVDWLLNYKGGSFGMDDSKEMEQLCKQRGVAFIKMSEKQYNRVLKEIEDPAFNGKVVKLEKAPKIAVYTPLNKEPWDDAVTLALTYAEIPFDRIYVDEVLAGELDKYDWLHLHHEDFTGQYGKFYGQFSKAQWYINDKITMEDIAHRHGYKKVSRMQLDVVKKIRDFVSGGGNMFAMCSATTTFDIALAADNTDICPAVMDGDPVDFNAPNKLDFTNTLAFRNFKVSLNEYEYAHSDIDNTNFRRTPEEADFFSILTPLAKMDVVPSMLCQNHTTTVKGFMGQNTAFRIDALKPNVMILGDYKSANEARYIHGELGKGSWTFYGGHDPEDYRHLIYNPPTDLSLHPNSPGYRLILNNVLFPSVKKQDIPTVTVNKETATTKTENVVAVRSVKMYPNPASNELEITTSTGVITSVEILNIAGQELISKTYNSAKAKVSLESLAPGMYMVKVNGEFIGKMVKE